VFGAEQETVALNAAGHIGHNMVKFGRDAVTISAPLAGGGIFGATAHPVGAGVTPAPTAHAMLSVGVRPPAYRNGK